MTQSGTPQAFIESLQAPNFLENTSITRALKFSTYLQALNLGYDSIVAIRAQGISGGEGAEEIPLSSITAAGISQDVPLYLFGKSGGNEYNVALDIQLIAGSDPVNSYVKLYAVRNPGAPIGAATDALFDLDMVRTPVTKALAKAKADTGIF